MSDPAIVNVGAAPGQPAVVQVGLQGPAGPPSLNPATVAALSALNDAALGAGQLALVATQRSWWVLDKTSTATLAANLVVATLSGTGRWIRQPWAHQSNCLQTLYRIDYTSGSDEATGAGTGALALKTIAEWFRRTGGTVGAGTAMDLWIDDVGILGTNGDEFTGTITANAPGASFFMHGTVTTVATSTITAAAVTVPSTNSPYQVTGVGLPAQAGNLIRNTTAGARLNSCGWIMTTLSGNNVAISQPEYWNSANYGIESAGDINSGDTVAVDTLPIVDFNTQLSFICGRQGAGLPGTISFENIHLRGSFAGSPIYIWNPNQIYMRNCELENVFVAGPGTANLINCNRHNCGWAGSGYCYTAGGVITGSGSSVSWGATEVHHDGTVIYASQLKAFWGGNIDIHGSRSSGAINCATPFVLSRNSYCTFGAHNLWGSGNTVSIFDLSTGSSVSYAPTGSTFYVTRTDQGNGGTADFRFDSRVVAASVSQLNVVSANVASSIANLNQGGGAAAVTLRDDTSRCSVYPSAAA